MEPGDFEEDAFIDAAERCRTRAPDAVRRLLHRVLPADEFQRLLAIPLTDAEREATRALGRWFTRRYPTPADRFAYIRRPRARWLGRPPRQP
jgi:hypothetical protein